MEEKDLKTGRIYLKDGQWYVKGIDYRFPIRKEDTTNLVDPYSCGKETCFELILINPMGRELDPNNVQQNHSNSEWQAKLWSTSEMVRNLQHYLEVTPKEELEDIMKEFDKYESVGPTVEEYFNPESYWEKLCHAAERYIEESPCDPDITSEQIKAYIEWKDIVNKESN